MNGIEAEKILKLVDANVELDRVWIAKYLRDHRDEIISSLRDTQEATIPTSIGGSFTIRTSDAA